MDWGSHVVLSAKLLESCNLAIANSTTCRRAARYSA